MKVPNTSFIKFLIVFILICIGFFLFGRVNSSSVFAGYACNTSCGENWNGCDGGSSSTWCPSAYGYVCRNPSCPEQTNCVCPYDVGGRVTYCGMGAASGVTVSVYNDTWGATTRTATTDVNGYWSISQMARNGDFYSVSMTAPGSYVKKTNESGWNWNYCVNPNVGTSPWGDTPLGSSSYECQKRLTSGSADCTGPNGSGTWNRCSFCLALPCASNLTATCTSPYRVNLNWNAIPDATNNVVRVDNTTNGWQGNEGDGAPNPTGFLGDRWLYSTPPTNNIIVTPGVAYSWSVQGMRSGEPYPYSGCGQAGPSFTCPTPTPVCGVPIAPIITAPNNGYCGKTEPPTYSIRQNELQAYCYAHDGWMRILQGSTILFTSGWNANRSAVLAPGGSHTYSSWEAGVGDASPPTYVPISLGTANYTLRTLTAANQHNSTYVQSSLGEINFSIDKSAPSKPPQATGTLNSGTCDFTWTPSTDTDCGGCSGKACKYWLQGNWTGGGEGSYINNGVWVPSDVTSPKYSVTCSGNEGKTLSVLVREAKDSLDNISSPDQTLYGTCACPAIPVCTSTDNSSISACSKTDPSFSSTYTGSSSQIEIGYGAVSGNPSTKTGVKTTPNPYIWAPSVATGGYYWGSQASGASCTTSSWTSHAFSIDKSAPSKPPQATGTLNSGTCDFTWTPSTDTDCGGCSGKACKYWLQGNWTGGGEGSYINNGVWVPSDVTSPKYSVTCSGNEGKTLSVLVREAKDSLDNISSPDQTLYGTCACPAIPVCTSTDNSSISACSKTDPSFSSTYTGSSSQIEIGYGAVSGNPSTKTGVKTTPNPYIWAPSVATGGYYWGSQASGASCTTSSWTSHAFSIDKSAPSKPPQATGTLNSGTCDFTWTPSTDTDCGGCSGKACKYWLQGNWTGGGEGSYINNGVWVPSDVTSPKYSVTCSGNEGKTLSVLVREAKDSLDNISSPDQTLYGTCACPAIPVCTSTDNSSISACSKTDPSFSSTYTGSSSQIEIGYGAVSGNPSTKTGVKTTPNPYIWAPSVATGGYYWGSQASGASCTTSSWTSHAFSIDKSAPSKPPQATGTLNSGTCDFTWTPSTDTDCGGCSGKACKYWLQGNWTGGGEGSYINNGVWVPSDVTSPKYSVTCSGNEGKTLSVLVREAKDSLDNISSPDQTLYGTCACPALFGSHQDYVWTDLNGNGSRQLSPAEGVGGASIRLDNGASTANYSSGWYQVVNIPNGSHTLYVTPPAGYVVGDRSSCNITVNGDDLSGCSFRLCSTTKPSNLGPSLGCENTVLRNYTWNAVPGASGYQFQLYVTDAVSTYWCVNDSTVSTNSFNLSSCENAADTKTGVVTWNVLARYPTSCVNSQFTSMTYNVDKSPPTTPDVPISSYNSINKTCDFGWTASTDIGCGNTTITYDVDAKWTAGGAVTSATTTDNFRYISCAGHEGVTAYFKATDAYDTKGNISGTQPTYWMCGCLEPSPTPTTIPPTPTTPPGVCAVSGETPTSGCYANIPSLSASFVAPADKVQIDVDENAGFPNPWSCNSDWQLTSPYTLASCSVTGTGTYYWGARAESSTSACSTPVIPNTVYSLSVDQDAPSTSSVPVGSYGSGLCTFTWTASTDVGCAECGTGKACKYWLQGNWNGDADASYINNGAWVPSSYASPSYVVSCSGNEGKTFELRAREAKDSLDNISSPDTMTQGSCVCPAPPSPTPTTIPPTPTTPPGVCAVSGETPTSGCYANIPSLSASFVAPADKVQIDVDENAGFPNPWSCNSDWQLTSPYTLASCSVTGTGTYYWGARAESSTSACSTPVIPNTVYSLSVDQDAPSTSSVPVGSYGSGLCTFTWTASTDVGCAECGTGKACKYWLQGNWNGDADASYINNGAWVPSSYASPSYVVSCSGNEGKTFELRAREAKDSLDNISSPDTMTKGSCVCGVGVPTATPTDVPPTPTPDNVGSACGNIGCSGDGDCNAGLVCRTDQWSPERMCMLPGNVTACQSQSIWEKCCVAPTSAPPITPPSVTCGTGNGPNVSVTVTWSGASSAWIQVKTVKNSVEDGVWPLNGWASGNSTTTTVLGDRKIYTRINYTGNADDWSPWSAGNTICMSYYGKIFMDVNLNGQYDVGETCYSGIVPIQIGTHIINFQSTSLCNQYQYVTTDSTPTTRDVKINSVPLNYTYTGYSGHDGIRNVSGVGTSVTVSDAEIDFGYAEPTPTVMCTISLNSPVSGCYASEPALSATKGGAGDAQVQFAVDIESGFNTPWSCNSNWGNSLYTPSPSTCFGSALVTDDYFWSARTSSLTDSCTESALASPYIFSIDKTPPPVQGFGSGLTCSVASDTITYNWTNVSDTGCFKDLGDVNYLFNLDGVDVGGWGTNNSYEITSATMGHTYKGKVKSKDFGNNDGGFGTDIGCIYCVTPATISDLTTSDGKTCTNTINRTYSWDVDNTSLGYQFQLVIRPDGGGPDIWCKNEPIAGSGNNSMTINICDNEDEIPLNTTGKIIWRVASKYDECGDGSFTEDDSILFDRGAPSKPTNRILSTTIDPNCIGKKHVKYEWDSVSDTGCGGLHPTPYWAQMSPDSSTDGTGGFTSIVGGWTNSWINATNQIAPTSYPEHPSGNIYAHVQSRDTFDNQSGWSTPAEHIIIPTPTLYPIIHIEGSYKEDTGGTSCSTMTLVNPPSLNLAFTLPSGATYDCTNDVNSYDCDITFNNQSEDGICLPPSQNITLNASFNGYTSIDWKTANTCPGGADNTVAVNLSSPPSISRDLFFIYGDQGWIKTKDSSVTSKTSGRNNIIPNAVEKYDVSDDTGEKSVIIGNSGALLHNGLYLGANVAPNTGYSPTGWYPSGGAPYVYTPSFTSSKLSAYVKSRKEYKTITDLNAISKDGVYLYQGDLPINSSSFTSNVVLIVNGTVTINSVDVNPGTFNTGKSVAILANTIQFSDLITEANGIFIADTIMTGAPANQGLKIKGNLIHLSTTVNFNNQRRWSNASKPSIFIVFDMNKYMDLLPYLSTSAYDWKKLQ